MAGHLQLGSQARLAKRALDARDKERDDYWAGATWVYDVNLRNGAGAGTISADVVPGEDNELEFISISIHNEDFTTRATNMFLEDGIAHDNRLELMVSLSTAANFTVGWPSSPSVELRGGGPGRRIISGLMNMHLEVVDVSANEDASFSIVARVRGEKPTVTTTFSAGGSKTIGQDQFF